MGIVANSLCLNGQTSELIKAFESSSLISVTDNQGFIIYANEAFCEISGYQEHELLGQTHHFLKSENQPDSLYKKMWPLSGDNKIWNGNISNRKKDGSLYWLNTTIIPFVDNLGNIEKYVSIYFDITTTKKNKVKLTYSQNKFKLLFDAAKDAYFITNLKGHIIDCNAATETMSGYKKKEIINKNLSDLGILNETDYLFFSKILKISSKKDHRCEFQITSKKGKKIDIEIVAHYMLNEGEPLVLNIVQNITERKTLFNNLQEKTNDLELLLYRSGHDLRAPFTSLEGLLNLMRHEPLTQHSIELLDMFETVLNDGKMLIDNLSTSSLMLTKNIKKEEVDFNQIVKQTIQNLKHLNGYETICFNINIPKVFKFISNAQLLESIVQNLLQNAIKYHRPYTENHTPFIIINAYKIDTGVEISIKDNGQGILEDEIDKVFNLYYRSNTTAEGTGLGLYITKNTVEQLKGFISIKSVINKETRFDIELPYMTL